MMTKAHGQREVPTVGEVWRRIGGKQRVKVNRLWDICGCDKPVMHAPDPAHGAEPVAALNVVGATTGNPLWWTVVPEFVERFERESDHA